MALHAVVGRQADDRDLVDVVLAQHRREIGLLEAGVALEVGLVAGVDDDVDPARSSAGCSSAPRLPCTQCGGQGPPCSANDAWSGGCQSRVATTRSNSPGLDQLVHARGDRVAVRHRQRAARGEVVLEVDDQERAGHVR